MKGNIKVLSCMNLPARSLIGSLRLERWTCCLMPMPILMFASKISWPLQLFDVFVKFVGVGVYLMYTSNIEIKS